MRHLFAALLFSTATFACSKAPDPGTAPTVAADPAAAPAAGAVPATAPAPTAAAPSPSEPAAAAPAAAAPAAAAEPATADDTAQPDLVEAAPGVQVVADYDTPVFFNGGQYWRYNDGGWYSSAVYTGGWELRQSPPQVIVKIDHPEKFVHYKPSGYVVHRRPAPQREWHPAPVRADVRVEPPHGEPARGEPPRVEPPHGEPPREEPPRGEPHAPPPAKVIVKEHRN